MMTQSVMGGILQTIFQLPPGFIVVKQGNWWNPQDKTNSGTWIAYLIRNARPSTIAMEQNNGDGTYQRYVNMIGDLELQFVGEDAERLAQSTSMWSSRPDINQLFDDNSAQIAYGDLGSYEVSQFTQAGLNNNLAYNVRCKIQWANMIRVSTTLVTVAPSISGNVTTN